MNRRNLCGIVILLLLLLLIGCRSPNTASSDNTAEEPANDLAQQVPPTSVPMEEPAEPWQVIHQLVTESPPVYTAFDNPQFGVYGCMSPAHLSYTTDGGQTWAQPDTPVSCLKDADIVDGQSIWQCGQFGLYASPDRGQTWEYLTMPTGEGCNYIDFIDEEHGWGASFAMLAATIDGGQSWESIALPEEIGKIAAISRRTEQDGYLLDYDGTLYSTSDNGSSWSARTIQIADSELEMASLGGPSAVIRFLDDENGLIILNLAGGGKGELIASRTADGGQSWEQSLLPVDLGILYLSQDGRYLTVTLPASGNKVVILENHALET